MSLILVITLKTLFVMTTFDFKNIYVDAFLDAIVEQFGDCTYRDEIWDEYEDAPIHYVYFLDPEIFTKDGGLELDCFTTETCEEIALGYDLNLNAVYNDNKLEVFLARCEPQHDYVTKWEDEDGFYNGDKIIEKEVGCSIEDFLANQTVCDEIAKRLAAYLDIDVVYRP